MKSYELPSMADIYFRVYFEEDDAYIIGFALKEDFFMKNSQIIKKMIKNKKSEDAIYLALPLKSGRSMDTLALVLKEKLYEV